MKSFISLIEERRDIQDKGWFFWRKGEDVKIGSLFAFWCMEYWILGEKTQGKNIGFFGKKGQRKDRRSPGNQWGGGGSEGRGGFVALTNFANLRLGDDD